MISLRQSQTLSLPVSISLNPLKPRRNNVFLAHLGTSSSSSTSSTTDSVPKKLQLDCAPTYRKITPPVNWGINFVGPNRAFIVERNGKYLKTLRTGLHLLNPIVDKITDVHSLKIQEIDIPVETIFSDGLEVMAEGVLFIKVVDPVLASYANNGDPISAVTQLIEASFPLGSMIEKMLFNPIFDELKASYYRSAHFDASRGFWNFEIYKDFGSFSDEFFTCVDFEDDDPINKITTASWGVKCLRLRMDICLPKEKLVKWEHVMVLLDALFSNVFFQNEVKLKRLYDVIKGKVDRVFKVTEILRDYYERRRGSGGGGEEENPRDMIKGLSVSN